MFNLLKMCNWVTNISARNIYDLIVQVYQSKVFTAQCIIKVRYHLKTENINLKNETS